MTGLLSPKHSGSSSDRRRALRVPCQMDVDIAGVTGKELQEPIKAWTLNLSLQGVCLRTFEDLTVGTNISLVVYHGGYDSVCLAEVIWKERAKAGAVYGLRIKQWSYLDRTLQSFLTHTA